MRAAFVPCLPLHRPHTRPQTTHRAPTARLGRVSGRSTVRDANEEYSSEVAEAERRYGRRSRSAAQKEAAARDTADAEYTRLRRRLLFDTLFVGVLWIAGTWSFGSVTQAESAILGVATSMVYVLLLSPDVGQLKEAGGDILASGKNKQPVRFLLLPLLVLGIAKTHGALHILPAVVGFLAYKVALVLPLVSGEAFRE